MDSTSNGHVNLNDGRQRQGKVDVNRAMRLRPARIPLFDIA
jgi:hypothetical protein